MRTRTPRPGIRRRPGQTAPLNGSVTRADIVAIHEDWKALGRGLSGPPPTIAEFMTFLLGAIQDPLPGPRTRARMAAAARRREARRRSEREAREQLAQPPSQTAAAA